MSDPKSASPRPAPKAAGPGAAERPVAIETRKLTKDYVDFWGRPRVRALDGLDLEVRPGEVFGLLGPNGSGKTTTMKLVLGLIWPTSGDVRVLGRDPRDPAARARVGFLPEETYLHKFLTGEETLEFHGRLFDIPTAERRRRSKELLERVGLSHARGRRIREYSRGMGRRIGLAQALINEPDLVMLDEPTAGLDPIATREVKDLILELKGLGRTVLVSSHLLADIEDVCDRIAILHSGRAKRVGKVDEILTVQNEVRFTARDLSDADAREAEEFLNGKASEVRMDRPRETLESVFIREVREAGPERGPVGPAGGARDGDQR